MTGEVFLKKYIILNSWLLKHFMCFSSSQVLFFFWSSHCPIFGQRAPLRLAPFDTLSLWQHPCFLVWADSPGSQEKEETQPSGSLKLSAPWEQNPALLSGVSAVELTWRRARLRVGSQVPVADTEEAEPWMLDEAPLCLWMLSPAPHRD